MAKYKLTDFVNEGEFKFKPTETDAPGMQAGPDGYLKEEDKIDEDKVEEKKEVEESFDYQHMMKVRAGIVK